jgi:ornithine--oxo-acid transaminase
VLGEMFRKALVNMKCPFVTKIRGKGLLNAIVIDEKFEFSAYEICLLFKERGLLAKPTHKHIIRLVCFITYVC